MATIVERVKKHRKNLRDSGMRPVQIWVPDTRRAHFSEECARQSSLIMGDALERDTLDYLAKAADLDGWTS